MSSTISICMIVKNEEKVLERCIRGVLPFADEIIVVDTGSNDNTKDIAYRFTDKVYDYKWIDDFSAARNYSFSLASSDYVMWIDADDIIDEENASKITMLKERLKDDAVLMFYERAEYGMTLYNLRMVKNSSNIFWRRVIHECLEGYESVLETDILIKHKKENSLDFKRNIRIMEKVTEKELLDDFSLCGNCYLDCVLDESADKAHYYLSIAERTQDHFTMNRINTILLIGMVLIKREKHEEVIRWGLLISREIENIDCLDHDTCKRISYFSLQAVKSAVILKKSNYAWIFNEIALSFDPCCSPALKNRSVMKTKLKEKA